MRKPQGITKSGLKQLMKLHQGKKPEHAYNQFKVKPLSYLHSSADFYAVLGRGSHQDETTRQRDVAFLGKGSKALHRLACERGQQFTLFFHIKNLTS